MAKYFGIDFIPWEIPIQRRLQMFAVVFQMMTFSIIPAFFTIGFVLLFFTRLWWVSAGYAVWLIIDTSINKTSIHGGRRSEWYRKGRIMKLFRDYFPITLEKTVDLDPTKNYVMGYHPHGIIAFGALCNFASDATNFSSLFPGVTPHMLTLDTNFYWPIMRAFTLYSGRYNSLFTCFTCWIILFIS